MKVKEVSKITILKTEFDLELEFKLIAINSALKDYRLCHFINKFANLNLQRANYEHSTADRTKNSSYYFTLFEHITDDFEKEQYLISNKGIQGGLLIPENPNFDYFLLIKNFIDEEDLHALVEALNKIPDVVLAKEILPKKLKSKENLIF
ncbi:IPExxxVDY family protein [Rhinopithecimicrobium faecis]|uniref:IPExxxVDY family protein n=1 Tax=Rhinopithecimicrobium faecis TaxID=2820698 RepID=UPI0033657236